MNCAKLFFRCSKGKAIRQKLQFAKANFDRSLEPKLESEQGRLRMKEEKGLKLEIKQVKVEIKEDPLDFNEEPLDIKEEIGDHLQTAFDQKNSMKEQNVAGHEQKNALKCSKKSEWNKLIKPCYLKLVKIDQQISKIAKKTGQRKKSDHCSKKSSDHYEAATRHCPKRNLSHRRYHRGSFKWQE